MFFQSGLFDQTYLIKQAIVFRSEIYILLKNGVFGKIQIGTKCIFTPLNQCNDLERILFVN